MMAPRLIKHFQKRKKLQKLREQYMAASYNDRYENWHKNIEEIDNCPKQK